MKTDSVSTASGESGTEADCLVFAGGGSGGHLTPAIALAEMLVAECPQKTFHFVFLCSGRQIDQNILRSIDLKNCQVDVVAQRLVTSSNRFKLCWNLWKDFLTARKLIRQVRPAAIIGTGGFASVAPVLAGWWHGTFLILMELNSVPGRATRFLRRLASVIWSGWPSSDESLSRNQSLQTALPSGIPLRPMKITAGEKAERNHHKTLVIVGGSLGAIRLNNMICAALAENQEALTDWKIIHQTGPNWQPTVSQLQACELLNWERSVFVPNLPEVFADADVVISRAGAVTLAELTRATVPSILVPLSTSADNHQLANAQVFQNANAALVVNEDEASSADSLADSLRQLITDENQRQRQQAAMQKLQVHLMDGNRLTDLISILQRSHSST